MGDARPSGASGCAGAVSEERQMCDSEERQMCDSGEWRCAMMSGHYCNQAMVHHDVHMTSMGHRPQNEMAQR